MFYCRPIFLKCCSIIMYSWMLTKVLFMLHFTQVFTTMFLILPISLTHSSNSSTTYRTASHIFWVLLIQYNSSVPFSSFHHVSDNDNIYSRTCASTGSCKSLVALNLYFISEVILFDFSNYWWISALKSESGRALRRGEIPAISVIKSCLGSAAVLVVLRGTLKGNRVERQLMVNWT